MKVSKSKCFWAMLCPKWKVQDEKVKSLGKARKVSSLNSLCNSIKVRLNSLNPDSNSADAAELWVSAFALNLEPIS